MCLDIFVIRHGQSMVSRVILSPPYNSLQTHPPTPRHTNKNSAEVFGCESFLCWSTQRWFDSEVGEHGPSGIVAPEMTNGVVRWQAIDGDGRVCSSVTKHSWLV